MASSDDEGEALAVSVANYYLVDDKEGAVPFSILPIQWREDTNPISTKNQIFLHGVADDGLQKIYKQVIAWKIEFSDEDPEISVLSKEKNWIKLLKPRKVYEETIRTILITVQCLHIVKQDPEIQGKPLWDQLRKVFSSYDIKPSENDLLDHIPLIRDAMKHDKTLSESKFLATFLEKPIKRREVDEDDHTGLDAKLSKFIVDDDEELNNDMGAADEDESDEESDLFDSVCCICDNGGELLCCEGRCMRSFHATVAAGAESDCKSLGLSNAQVKAIQNFLCLNCQRKQHQCFACGKLGSSDKSSGAEVFSCVSATCGFFYHPDCVAKLLHPTEEAEAEDLKKKIAAGESFTCPAHRCHICKERENKDVHDLQFAVCRRCPRAYHRKCLPRKIAFDDSDAEEDVETRAWSGLLPNNRILIYCLKHKIDEDLGTPVRNHIVFPRDEKKNILQSNKGKVAVKRRFAVDADSFSENLVLKKPKSSSDARGTSSLTKREKPSTAKEWDYSERSKISDASRKLSKDSLKTVSVKADKSSPLDEKWLSMAEGKLNSMLKKKGLGSADSNQQETTGSKLERTEKSAPLVKRQSSSALLVDAETKKRIMALMENKASSISLEEVLRQHKVPSTHGYSSKTVVDKTITLGKVEGFVEAVRTALQKLEEGSSVEDAKAVCGPEIVNQILKWKNKLKVYLAPFLHGMRYTSFGRHFTKEDKLKEIVDKIHWYVHEGDTVVDFCCGSNDFSLLMKGKLEETGKNCFFKNFDVIQPKNDFNFEKRDWMTVRPKELPIGSKLIMGLNPPFGVKAALANKFIDKALEFKPKLLILIVPPETERLDKKEPPYDLVWEDEEKLSGKSFYLPGSVDVNDNQMDQWNVKPPLLYLWSRSDWTAKHKEIALKQGHASKYQKEPRPEENHISKNQKEPRSEENRTPMYQSEPYSEENRTSMYQKEPYSEENHDAAQLSDIPMDISPIRDYPGDKSTHADVSNQMNDFPERKNKAISEETITITPRHKSQSSPAKHDTSGQQIKSGEDHSTLSGKKKRSRKNKKERQDNIKQLRNMNEASPDGGNDREQSHLAGISRGTPSSLTSSNQTDNKNLVEERQSGLDYRAGYGGIGTSVPADDLDEIARRYAGGSSFHSETRRWSTDASHSQEYGIRGLDGYRNPYTSNLGEYRAEPDVRQILQRYGGQGSDSSQMGHLPGPHPRIGRVGPLPSTYGIPGPAESSYSSVTQSTMQRYAPRLDEPNHGRMSAFGSDTSQTSRSGIYDSRGSQYTPDSGFHTSTPGFAPAPARPFPPHNSTGWLNE